MKMIDQNLLVKVPNLGDSDNLITLNQIHELSEMKYQLTTILKKVN